MSRLLANDPLIVAVLAWTLAQVSKLLIVLLRERQLQLAYLTSAGGMPSSHSAVVVALATRIGLETGLSSVPFALAAVFAAVVMYDAAGVRRAVSLQARVLNRMLTEMLEAQQFNERRLRELIGHTPVEVLVGAALGLLIALLLT
jgi:acid phosphatase family membrane protein YuiD